MPPPGAPRQRACGVLPWVPALCVVLMAVGIPLWIVHALSAAESTRGALAVIAADQQGAAAVARGLAAASTVRTVVLVLAVASVLLALILATAEASKARAQQRHGHEGVSPSALRSYAAADALTSALLWLLMLGAVALLCLYTTWYLGSWAASSLLNTATQYSSTAEKAAVRAVSAADLLVDQLKVQQLQALDAAPQEVKDSGWFRDFHNSIQNFNQTLASVAGTPGAGAACQRGCVSLGLFAGLAGLNTTCVCVTNTILSMQAGLAATQQAMMLALVGMLLLWLAASWLVLHFAARYVHTRRDLHEQRARAKFSGTGERGAGLGSSPSSSFDAAISIDSSPSSGGFKALGVSAPRSGAAGQHAPQRPLPYV